MYKCSGPMLDKETVERQNRQGNGVNTFGEDSDHFAECLERAKRHVDKEEVKECFDRALGLETINRI